MRPNLDKNLDPEIFINHYWLKNELVSFLREVKLQTSGGKSQITERIYEYLRTGKVIASQKKIHRKGLSSEITHASVITSEYKNSENVRLFFKNNIGEHFKFNLSFMNWMKSNPEKTFAHAIDEWKNIETNKKSGIKKVIPKQFEYNQYTRDFFNSNPKKSRVDCIKCWKYKKSKIGNNTYESADLEILN